MTDVPPTDEMLKLARFRILDRRNCNEAAKDKLLGLMADEIERLQKILRDWGICGWERRAPHVPAAAVCDTKCFDWPRCECGRRCP